MRKTVRDMQKMKADGLPITVVTAYDMSSARLAEAAGVSVLLVGDSLGMVVQGHELPIPVTLEHMIYHCAIVTRVTREALIIGDMPFMSYNISPEQALTNAGRLIQEGGVSAVKMEGGAHLAPTIRRLVEAGIPVMGHIGLQPQSVHQIGGMKAQGRDIDSALHLLEDAHALAAAGVFSMVIEAVPSAVAEKITHSVSVPTIGIGAGPACSGQVQVFHDLLGLYDAYLPRHARRYADAGALIRSALTQYREDVEAGRFPTEEHSFSLKPEVLKALEAVDDEADAG